MGAILHAADAASTEQASVRPCNQQYLALRGLELWHLLSLDAPTVAVVWTWFLAHTAHIALPGTAILAMGIAVWMLYTADRLLDARAIEPKTVTQLNTIVLSGVKKNCISLEPPTSAELEPRHHFHRHHERAFRVGILSAAITLAFLLPKLKPQSIHLYLVLGTMLVVYLILIHLKTAGTHRLPKELAVGVFFSAAVFIPTVARAPGLRLALLPGAVLFAAVCSLNCLFIYAWEHPSAPSQTHPATNVALRFLSSLAIAATAIGFILAVADRRLTWPIPIACATATLLLMLLHRNCRRFSPTTLRASADLCLLTPLLLLHV